MMSLRATSARCLQAITAITSFLAACPFLTSPARTQLGQFLGMFVAWSRFTTEL